MYFENNYVVLSETKRSPALTNVDRAKDYSDYELICQVLSKNNENACCKFPESKVTCSDVLFSHQQCKTQR